MIVRLIVSILLLLGSKETRAQSKHPDQKFTSFMGQKVTVVESRQFSDGCQDGPASVCVEGPPQRRCYTAPKDFGNTPSVKLVEVRKDMPALLFSAASCGVSGWGIHFALLCPGLLKEIPDVLPNVTVSNQSQYSFWKDSSLSEGQMFLTADYAWGPDEGHFGEHRYTISVYVLDHDLYYLADRYMTVRKYDLETADVLGSEKHEILARLRRIRAETQKR